jgi:phosphate butyryltransferase
MIRSLDQMVAKVLSSKRKFRIAVAWAQDSNTVGAIQKAVNDGFAEAIMIGNGSEIVKLCQSISFKKELYTIIESGNESTASQDAVRLVKSEIGRASCRERVSVLV